MVYYSKDSVESLIHKKELLEKELDFHIEQNYNLNMARGKPCKEQSELSNNLLMIDVSRANDFEVDYKNYGVLDGIDEMKVLFANILEVKPEEVIIGGNSSLNMMYNILADAMLFGTADSKRPWSKEEKIKFICPVPGYDRHFAICELLGMEMIPIEMNESGLDIDMIEEIVEKDPLIKGMWCVPKYSNPSGITYSEEVVKRLASMKTAAIDFRIIWDNAYVVHDLYDDIEPLTNILKECKLADNPNRPYLFTSMSKVTIPGAAVAGMAMSEYNIKEILRIMSAQTIGYDKINQYRHIKFLKNMDGIKKHMKKHRKIIGPKFQMVVDIFREHLADKGIATWSEPKGGYFISLDVLPGCARETVKIAKSAGVILTPAGATYPYGKDPLDKNIRIAPTFPEKKDLKKAIEILCTCIELVSIKKILEDK